MDSVKVFGGYSAIIERNAASSPNDPALRGKAFALIGWFFVALCVVALSAAFAAGFAVGKLA